MVRTPSHTSSLPPPLPLNLEDDQRLSNSTFTVIKKICIVCCVFIAVHILLLPSHKPCFSMLPFKICLRHPSGTSFLTGASLPKKVLDSPPPPPKDPTSQRFGTESCAVMVEKQERSRLMMCENDCIQ